MKTKIRHAFTIAILALTLPVSGDQQPRLPMRFVPPGVQPSEPAAAGLPCNVKLTLEGSLLGLAPADFSVVTGDVNVSSGTDPDYSKDAAPSLGSFKAVIRPGDFWLVAVDISVSLPAYNKNGGFEYMETRLSTTVRIVPGKKVLLWEKGDKKLTLSIQKVDD